MKLANGIWFPDDELHLVKMLKSSRLVGGKGTYQYHKLEAALGYVKRRRCALDVGMHVGLWAMHLVKEFATVIGFEPVASHIECLKKNMANVSNYQVHGCALGNRSTSVGLHFLNGSTGSTQIADDGQDIPMKMLDEFSFDAVDFIKIDVEGYEYFVVEGGEKTIKMHKPVVILEQKPNTNQNKLDYGKKQFDALNLLKSWGAKQVFDINGDCCVVWG